MQNQAQPHWFEHHGGLHDSTMAQPGIPNDQVNDRHALDNGTPRHDEQLLQSMRSEVVLSLIHCLQLEAEEMVRSQRRSSSEDPMRI